MKTVSFDKYPSIFSRQMEVILVFVTRAVLKIGEYHVQACRSFVTVYNFKPKLELRLTALFLYISLTVFVFVGICLVRKMCRHVLGFKQHLTSYSIVAQSIDSLSPISIEMGIGIKQIKLTNRRLFN